MRDVDPALLALAADDDSDLFWTLTLTFPEPIGEVYLADRDITVDGLPHDGLVVHGGFGTIERMATQEEKRLDVSTVRITVNNFPRLSTGERVTDLFIDEIETVIGDLYLNARDRAGGIHREFRFSGVVQNDIDANEERAVLTRSALRTIGDDFQYARQDARGATIPVILGVVNRAPGRVVKQGIHTRALPVFTNVGSARLNLPDFDSDLDLEFDDDGPSQPNWDQGRGFPSTPPSPGDSGGCPTSPCDFGAPPDTGDGGGLPGSFIPTFGPGSGGVLSCWSITNGTLVDLGDGEYGIDSNGEDFEIELKCACAELSEGGSYDFGATFHIAGGHGDQGSGFGCMQMTALSYAEDCSDQASPGTLITGASSIGIAFGQGSNSKTAGHAVVPVPAGRRAGMRMSFSTLTPGANTFRISNPFLRLTTNPAGGGAGAVCLGETNSLDLV